MTKIEPTVFSILIFSSSSDVIVSQFSIILMCKSRKTWNLLTGCGVALVGVKGESDFEAAQLLVLAAQDALHTVVTVSQPGGQIHVGQVEVRLRQRVRASLEGAVAGQPVGVQRFRTVLTRRDQLVQNITCILIVTTAHLLQTGDLHPETCHLLLQGHIQLMRREKGRGDDVRVRVLWTVWKKNNFSSSS